MPMRLLPAAAMMPILMSAVPAEDSKGDDALPAEPQWQMMAHQATQLVAHPVMLCLLHNKMRLHDSDIVPMTHCALCFNITVQICHCSHPGHKTICNAAAAKRSCTQQL